MLKPLLLLNINTHAIWLINDSRITSAFHMVNPTFINRERPPLSIENVLLMGLYLVFEPGTTGKRVRIEGVCWWIENIWFAFSIGRDNNSVTQACSFSFWFIIWSTLEQDIRVIQTDAPFLWILETQGHLQWRVVCVAGDGAAHTRLALTRTKAAGSQRKRWLDTFADRYTWVWQLCALPGPGISGGLLINRPCRTLWVEGQMKTRALCHGEWWGWTRSPESPLSCSHGA